MMELLCLTSEESLTTFVFSSLKWINHLKTVGVLMISCPWPSCNICNLSFLLVISFILIIFTYLCLQDYKISFSTAVESRFHLVPCIKTPYGGSDLSHLGMQYGIRISFSFFVSHIAMCFSVHYVCFRSHQLQLTHVQYACVVWVQKMIWKPTCYGHILVMASTGRHSSKSWLKTNGEIFIISIKHILSALWSKWQVYPYIDFIAPFIGTQKCRIFGRLTSMVCSHCLLKCWAVDVIR